jgi:predicted alpha/beta hydrolase family esterase
MLITLATKLWQKREDKGMSEAPSVLILPGWQDSGPAHWQSRWEALHGYTRVQQADWIWPRRGDWMARLEEVVLEHGQRPIVLVAHSLACHLVAWWAEHTQHSQRVLGALLVAPPDTEREAFPPQLHNWRSASRQGLPFAARLLYSSDDPYCTADCSLALAHDWGASAFSVGAVGHINGDSGLGDWPAGLTHLRVLMNNGDGRDRGDRGP